MKHNARAAYRLQIDNCLVCQLACHALQEYLHTLGMLIFGVYQKDACRDDYLFAVLGLHKDTPDVT